MKRARSGFTLVEILVVIVIIGVLAAIAMVGVTAAMRAARANGSETLLRTLGSACESYKTKWGDYPPTTMTDWKVSLPNDVNNGAEALTACLTSTLKGGPVFQEQSAEAFGNVDEDSASSNLTKWWFGDNQLREILDSYGRPVMYLHQKDYTRTSAPTTKYLLSADGEEATIKAAKVDATKTFANPGKFQMWSAGADGVPGTADDIVGW